MKLVILLIGVMLSFEAFSQSDCYMTVHNVSLKQTQTVKCRTFLIRNDRLGRDAPIEGNGVQYEDMVKEYLETSEGSAKYRYPVVQSYDTPVSESVYSQQRASSIRSTERSSDTFVRSQVTRESSRADRAEQSLEAETERATALEGQVASERERSAGLQEDQERTSFLLGVVINDREKLREIREQWESNPYEMMSRQRKQKTADCFRACDGVDPSSDDASKFSCFQKIVPTPLKQSCGDSIYSSISQSYRNKKSADWLKGRKDDVSAWKAVLDERCQQRKEWREDKILCYSEVVELEPAFSELIDDDMRRSLLSMNSVDSLENCQLVGNDGLQTRKASARVYDTTFSSNYTLNPGSEGCSKTCVMNVSCQVNGEDFQFPTTSCLAKSNGKCPDPKECIRQSGAESSPLNGSTSFDTPQTYIDSPSATVSE